MIENSNESGRSMVEMLGTLAIVGVLSVTGVAGYREAIERYRANEIIEEVQKRALLGSQQRLKGKEEVNLSEFSNTINETYEVTIDIPDESTFAIQVASLPQNICERILSINWDLPGKISGAENNLPATCIAENNIVTFRFRNDLRKGRFTPEEDHGCKSNEIWDSAHEVCHTPCLQNEEWTKDCQCCHEICTGGKVWKTSACECPDDKKYFDGSKCVSTCPNSKPYMDGFICVSECPYERKYNENLKCVVTCSMAKPYINNSSCVSSCSGGKPYADGDICVSSCPWQKPYYYGNNCVSRCPYNQPYIYNSTCVDACPYDKPYPDYDNVCRYSSGGGGHVTNSVPRK